LKAIIADEEKLRLFIDLFTQISSESMIDAIIKVKIEGFNSRKSALSCGVDDSALRKKITRVDYQVELVTSISAKSNSLTDLTSEQLEILFKISPSHSGNDIYKSISIWHLNMLKGKSNKAHLIGHSYNSFWRAKSKLGNVLSKIIDFNDI
jgi:hypothetical protein